MVKFEFEYTKIDGLLYPIIEIDGKAEFDNLRKYGLPNINYLHEQKPWDVLATAFDRQVGRAYAFRLSGNAPYVAR